jgi:hypothetical protein
MEDTKFEFQERKDISLFSQKPREALGPIQLSLQWVLGSFPKIEVAGV